MILLRDLKPSDMTYELGLYYRDLTKEHPVPDQIFRCRQSSNDGWVYEGELVRLVNYYADMDYFFNSLRNSVILRSVKKLPQNFNVSANSLFTTNIDFLELYNPFSLDD